MTSIGITVVHHRDRSRILCSKTGRSYARRALFSVVCGYSEQTRRSAQNTGKHGTSRMFRSLFTTPRICLEIRCSIQLSYGRVIVRQQLAANWSGWLWSVSGWFISTPKISHLSNSWNRRDDQALNSPCQLLRHVDVTSSCGQRAARRSVPRIKRVATSPDTLRFGLGLFGESEAAGAFDSSASDLASVVPALQCRQLRHLCVLRFSAVKVMDTPLFTAEKRKPQRYVRTHFHGVRRIV